MDSRLKPLFIFPLGIVASVIFYIFIFGSNPNLFYFLSALALLLALLPTLLVYLNIRNKQKEKEIKFLEFTRDLVEGVKTGTPVNKVIINLQSRSYGALTPHIKKLANQIYFGINLDKALETFAKETKSKVISRAVSLISEAHKAGGKIETIIQSVAGSVNQIQVLEKEKMSSVFNLVIQGYIIFFVFIVIMLVLEYAILPLAVEFSETNIDGLTPGTSSSGPVTKADFSTPLFFMLIVQALFAGIVIGKVSEGTIFAGIKHSFILTSATILIVTGTRAVLG